MENNFKYFEYISNKSDYYQKPQPKESAVYSIENLSKEWVVNKDDMVWTMYYIPDMEILVQGFKIHISTTYENAEETLAIVSNILIKTKTAFKHIKDKNILYNMYSKHGSRVSSGKFITIYPNENEFMLLIKELELALSDQPKGPYILTDRRWKDSNVYYRYGGFQTLKDDQGRHCIMDDKGNLIPDIREPRFYLPNFVELPEEIKKQDELMASIPPKEKSALQSYEIEKVIRFSNSGGIYVGKRKEDGKKCIIKEARNEIGLDSQNRNAMHRLDVEYNAISKLNDVLGVVSIMDYFKVWENKFLVLEFVEGQSLYTWTSANYPFSRKVDVNEYFNKVAIIIERLTEIIKQMHQRGVAMCDLQYQNVIIGENLKVTLIDFEIAEEANSKSYPAMATLGFSNMLNTVAKDRDWYSLNRLMHFLLLPMGPVYELDMSTNVKHCIWIYNNFGREVYHYYKKFQKIIRNNLTNYDQIFLETFEMADQKIEQKDVNEKIYAKDILHMLEKALVSNCNSNTKTFINGDIRQFEMDCGMLNLQNGGFGAVLALLRLNNFNDDARAWIEKQIPDLVVKDYNNGFLTGRSGVACVLYECGYKKEAIQVMDLVVGSCDKTSKDISLRSGLSGIGVALACIGSAENKKTYLAFAKEIADVLYDKVDNNEEPEGTDWLSITIGLLDGYSGISLFYTVMYQITKNEKYLSLSEWVIKKELDCAKFFDEDGKMYLVDNKTNRMYPYLSNGGIGLGIAITALNNTQKITCYEDEMEAIVRSLDYRVTLEPGLLDGISGFLLASCFQNSLSMEVEDTIDILNLFLIKKQEGYYIPGKMFYKLSADLHTGIAGVILGILSAESKNPLTWLPMVNNIVN